MAAWRAFLACRACRGCAVAGAMLLSSRAAAEAFARILTSPFPPDSPSGICSPESRPRSSPIPEWCHMTSTLRCFPTMLLSTGLSGCRREPRRLTVTQIPSTFRRHDFRQDFRLPGRGARRPTADHRDAPAGTRQVRLGRAAVCLERPADRGYAGRSRRPDRRTLGTPIRRTLHYRLCDPQYQPMQGMP